MIKEITVMVTQEIKVTLDSSKLNVGFNKEFSEMMWDVDCLEDHAEHLAQMKARGMIGFDNYVEGYGDLSGLNITVNEVLLTTDIEN